MSNSKTILTVTGNINIEQNSVLEDIVGQMQLLTTKLLCIIDNKYIHFYDDTNKLPKNVIFVKEKHHNIPTYYFQKGQTIYTVFGAEAKEIFSQSLEPVKSKNSIIEEINNNLVVIIDKGVKMMFPNPNLPVIIEEHTSS